MCKEYKYKFSIVMAIYNVEQYLEEAIVSVITQDIGFVESVQLILVNDGSLDSSEEICKKYKQLYPDNIIYISKENGGVSSARNVGLKYVEGKYINFLDSDDKLDKNVLSNVEAFFEQYGEYVDVAAIKMKFFEANNNEHVLNYKFKKTKIVDILSEYEYIQLSSSSAFIKNTAIKGKLFDESLKYLEDAYLITKIILEKKCYGVISDITYFCRKRKASTSATQNLITSREWYTPTLKKFHLSILEEAKLTFGYIPKYIQYLVMYDLQWRIKQTEISNKVLKEDEQEEYIENIKKIIKQIDDIIIKKQKNLWIEHKLYCFKLKYDLKQYLNSVVTSEDIKFYYKDKLLYSMGQINIVLEFIEVDKENLIIEGFIPQMLLFDMENVNINVNLDNDQYYFKLEEKESRSETSLGRVIMKKAYFKITIPIEKILNQYFEILLSIENIKIKNNYRFGKFIPLYKNINGSYFEKNGFTIKYENNKFIIKKNKKIESLKDEIKFVHMLSKKSKKQALLRISAYIIKKLNRQPIWVFMDRIDKADDNAEALFKYVQDKPNIRSYFILGDQADDYKRLCNIGKTIPYKSIRQKIVLLLADKVVSSQVEHYLREPFKGKGEYLRNLCNFEFVFLQHGITKDDMSNLFNKHNKNIDLFITAGIPEYESMFKYDYDYSDRQVKLTGFPRHDFLDNKPKRQIVIMPTWRLNIVSKIDNETGARLYNENFKETKYFKTYNKLINDNELINLCKKYNYNIIFLPHPNMMQQIKDFDRNEYVYIVEDHVNYNKVICESDCLITDYSSVSFEFGYMKKPVIYYQFDYDEVFNDKIHSYEKGYYDYETMGFGPISYEYDDLIIEIKKIISNECVLENKYIDRVDKFFKYTDKENCKRVFEEICKLNR